MCAYFVYVRILGTWDETATCRNCCHVMWQVESLLIKWMLTHDPIMDVYIQTCVGQFLMCIVVSMQFAPLALCLLFFYIFPHMYVRIHSLTVLPNSAHTHSYTFACDIQICTYFCRIAQCTLVKKVYPVHGNSSVKLHPTLWTLFIHKPIAVHVTMKHLKGGQGNLTTLLGCSTSSRKQH